MEWPGRIDEPSAWTAAELAADPSWVQVLERAEIEALEAAADALRAAGPSMFELTREALPMPRLGERIRHIAHALERGRGCIVLRGIDVERHDLPTIKAMYWALGVHLGVPISQNAKGERIAHVTDSGRDYQQKNVRGYTTRAALRPHCDAADVVGLLCWRDARTGGESLMASSVSIYNEILRTRPEYLPPLFRGFHYDLRGEGVTGDPDEVTFQRVPVFSWFAGRLSARFNQKSIEDGMRKAGLPLAPGEQAAIDTFAELALSSELGFRLAFRPGDIQLLNNHLIVHARTAFEDWPEPDRKRNLLRLWVNLHEGRPLAPAFADRLNTGPRGGVRVAGGTM